MTTIQERLRALADAAWHWEAGGTGRRIVKPEAAYYREAAAEIDRLQAALKASDEALKEANAALLFLMGTAPLVVTTDGWLEANGIMKAITSARQ